MKEQISEATTKLRKDVAIIAIKRLNKETWATRWNSDGNAIVDNRPAIVLHLTPSSVLRPSVMRRARTRKLPRRTSCSYFHSAWEESPGFGPWQTSPVWDQIRRSNKKEWQDVEKGRNQEGHRYVSFHTRICPVLFGHRYKVASFETSATKSSPKSPIRRIRSRHCDHIYTMHQEMTEKWVLYPFTLKYILFAESFWNRMQRCKLNPRWNWLAHWFQHLLEWHKGRGFPNILLVDLTEKTVISSCEYARKAPATTHLDLISDNHQMFAVTKGHYLKKEKIKNKIAERKMGKTSEGYSGWEKCYSPVLLFSFLGCKGTICSSSTSLIALTVASQKDLSCRIACAKRKCESTEAKLIRHHARKELAWIEHNNSSKEETRRASWMQRTLQFINLTTGHKNKHRSDEWRNEKGVINRRAHSWAQTSIYLQQRA